MEKERRGGMTAAVGVVTFLMGILVGTALNGYGQSRESGEVPELESETVEQSDVMTPEQLAAEGYLAADVIRVRVEDGQVQWYDGRLWNQVSSVEELEKQDRFSLAEDAFKAFEEELRQEKAAGREKIIGEEQGTILVGQKETPKTTRPNTTATAPQEPEETIPEAGGGDSGGGSGDSGGGGNPPADSGGTPNPPPEVTQPPTDSGSTGDGEDSVWSDDYL